MIVFFFICFITIAVRSVNSDCLVKSNYARFRRDSNDFVSNRIIDGEDATVHYPFMVSIQSARGHLKGGGIIIERHWILSVAHLFEPKRGFNHVRVGFGSNDLSKQTLVPIEAIYPHAQFNRNTLENDIVLIRTRDPLLYRNRTSVIYLPFPPKREPVNLDSLLIIGWGDVKFNKTNRNGDLQQGQVKLVEQEECNRVHNSRVGGAKVGGKQICLYSRHSYVNTRACIGDSGGPAFELLDGKPIVVGLSSWTAPGCAPNYPNVFTKVSHYLEWICQTVKKFK